MNPFDLQVDAPAQGPAFAFKRREALCALLGLTLAPWMRPAYANSTRIVALDWSLVQTLLSLGLVPLAAAETELYRLSVREPPLPNSVQELGLRSEPNLELLTELRPELILISNDQGLLRSRLSTIAPTEVFSPMTGREDAYTRVEHLTQALGARLGLQERALSCVQTARTGLMQAKQRLAARPPPGLLIVSLVDDRRAMVFGRHSLFDETLRQLGLQNRWTGPTNAWGYATVGFERLAEHPDAQLLYFNPMPALAPRLETNPLWRNLPSVKAGTAKLLPEVLFYGGLPSVTVFARLVESRLAETFNA